MLKFLKSISLLILPLFLCPMFVPLASALPQQQNSVQILGVTINGNVETATYSVNGAISTVTGNMTTGRNGDPTVTTSAGYATWPQYIGNPPYAAWWNGISNPPEIYVYVDSNVAFNSGNGIAAIAGLLAILAAATGGIAAGVAAGVIGLLYLDYSTIYGADHNPDGSLSLWIPADWVNYVVLFEGTHDLYLATPNYWWLCLPGIAFRSSR